VKGIKHHDEMVSLGKPTSTFVKHFALHDPSFIIYNLMNSIHEQMIHHVTFFLMTMHILMHEIFKKTYL